MKNRESLYIIFTLPLESLILSLGSGEIMVEAKVSSEPEETVKKQKQRRECSLLVSRLAFFFEKQRRAIL